MVVQEILYTELFDCIFSICIRIYLHSLSHCFEGTKYENDTISLTFYSLHYFQKIIFLIPSKYNTNVILFLLFQLLKNIIKFKIFVYSYFLFEKFLLLTVLRWRSEKIILRFMFEKEINVEIIGIFFSGCHKRSTKGNSQTYKIFYNVK